MGLSTHVLDTAIGRPAPGIALELELADEFGEWQHMGRGRTDSDGRCRDLISADAFAAGTYRLTFALGDYLGPAAFYPQATVEFRVADPSQHFHIPLLLSPFGYSTYRGS